MKLLEFNRQYGDETTIIERLRQLGILKTHLRCSNCGEAMKERTTDKSDGRMFECAKRTCRRARSVREGSFLEKSRLTLCDCILFLYLWCKEYPAKLIIEDLTFSNNTVCGAAVDKGAQ
jgi:hypothetical protein